jgi:crotonobetainyl-CoA:carnitine CoA-transferase CaiB-like acyl-CoA transferase
VRALEVASHVFVPIGGGVLTGQGAEVIKIEHPAGGDPYRGLVTAGLHKTPSTASMHGDPQVAANGYLAEVEMGDGSSLTLVNGWSRSARAEALDRLLPDRCRNAASRRVLERPGAGDRFVPGARISQELCT